VPAPAQPLAPSACACAADADRKELESVANRQGELTHKRAAIRVTAPLVLGGILAGVTFSLGSLYIDGEQKVLVPAVLTGAGSLGLFVLAGTRFKKRAELTPEIRALEARRRELVRKIETSATACTCDLQSARMVTSASDELAQIDARLDELRHALRKRSLAGPRALTIGGLAGAPALAGLGVAVWLFSAFAGDWDEGESNVGTRVGAAMMFAAPLSLVVGLAGVPWLVRTKRERRPFVLEQRELKARRRELTTFQPVVTPTSLGLSLRMRF
jgi:hypothetical protein